MYNIDVHQLLFQEPLSVVAINCPIQYQQPYSILQCRLLIVIMSKMSSAQSVRSALIILVLWFQFELLFNLIVHILVCRYPVGGTMSHSDISKGLCTQWAILARTKLTQLTMSLVLQNVQRQRQLSVCYLHVTHHQNTFIHSYPSDTFSTDL